MRSIISVFVATLFLGLCVSGIWLFITKADSYVVFLHVFFGALFLCSALFHFSKNLKSLIHYLKNFKGKVAVLLSVSILTLALLQIQPIPFLNIAYARMKAQQPSETDASSYEIFQMKDDTNLTIEIRAGKHFWFPQMALWIEDSTGNFVQSLMVTHSTAKGEFIGGRTKENYRSFDSGKGEEIFSDQLRRVDALPYWSHARGIRAPDGLYTPLPSDPLPDAITGATPSGSFLIESSYPELSKFKLLLEVNVAFDDNRFFSEYDYPDDSLYHSGTGLLGQPSVVYEVDIDLEEAENYYVMHYKGRTFPSGASGELFLNKKGLTTALQIVDLALVKINTF